MKIFISFWLFLQVLGSNFSINIPKYADECFYEELKQGDRLDISFEVMFSSGLYETDFKV
jgi:hypothetical protein